MIWVILAGILFSYHLWDVFSVGGQGGFPLFQAGRRQGLYENSLLELPL